MKWLFPCLIAPVGPTAPAHAAGGIAKQAQAANAINTNKCTALEGGLAIALFRLTGWAVALPISTVSIRIHNNRASGCMNRTGRKNGRHRQS